MKKLQNYALFDQKKRGHLPYFWSDSGIRTVLNLALTSLYKRSLEITVTVPLSCTFLLIDIFEIQDDYISVQTAVRLCDLVVYFNVDLSV